MTTMRGQVLGLDTRTGHGLVAGDDGRRYTFLPADWAQHGEPVVGQIVDFETQDGHARNIFALPGPAPVVTPPPLPVSDRNKYVAALLAFFLGPLGIHRFYIGRTGSGIAMLVLTFTVVGLLVTGLWALVDTVRYLMMSDREFAARYPRLD